MQDTLGQRRETGLTVLVFKENLVARTFQVPLSWITRFGIVVSSLLILATGATVLAVRYYRVAERSDASRVEDLERELDTLRSAYQALEVKAANAPSVPLTAAPAIPANATPAPAPVDVTAEATGTPAPARALLPLPGGAGSSLLFSALPSDVQLAPADPSALSIRIQTPKVQWIGKKLRVGFAIQYVRADGGSQQGRILILARGGETLLSYPEGAVNPAGTGSLLAPDKGEYFSVGRFREVRAEFPAVPSEAALKDVEVLLLSQSGQMLIYDRFEVPVVKTAAKPKAAPKAAAQPDAQPTTPAAPATTPPASEAPQP